VGDRGGVALMPWGRLATPQSLGGIIAGIIDPKRTVYAGVVMRSRLEADFARHLDGERIVWRYEPAVYGPPGRGYLPDFELLRDDGRHFVEVKPRLRDVVGAQKRIRIILETHADSVLIVACAEECRFFASDSGGDWITWVDRWAHS
jgi:hypothetical protein